MKAWRFAKTDVSPIGLDLSARSIRLLQVTRDDPPHLLSAAAAELPADLGQDPKTRESYIVEQLSKLLKAGGFKGRRVVMAIPPARMHVQHLRLARTEDSRLDEPIEAELRKRLGVDPACLVVRTVEVGEVFTDGAAKREVICMATGRNVVMRHVQLASRAHLRVVGMHGQPLAITTAFAHLFRRADDKHRTTGFIDIGASQTKVMILHGGDLAFAKMIQVTADQLNASPAAPQAVEAERVEQPVAPPMAAAVAAGVAGPGATAGERTDDRRGAGGSMPGLAVLEASRQEADAAPAMRHEMLDCLIDELQLCVGYHRSLYPDRPIEKLVFLGGGSSDHARCRRIASALQLPADLGDPLARLVRATDAAPPIGVDLRQRQGAWACPLGLCLLPADL